MNGGLNIEAKNFRVQSVFNPWPNRFWFALALALWFLGALGAQAHDPGLSALALELRDNQLIADLSMAPADVNLLAPSPDGQPSAAQLKKLAANALAVDWDGQPAHPAQIEIQRDDASRAIHFRMVFSRDNASTLQVRSLLIPQLGRGHREYLAVRGPNQQLLAEKMLDAGQNTFEQKFDAPTMAASAGNLAAFPKFLALGIEHILTGYDHICFLLGLLIVGGNLRDVLKIITAFTIAHSITLALATLNLLRLPSSIIEPLIAVSIVYVGIENLLRRDLRRRWLLSFGFGLVHGCGFASALRDLHIGANGAGIAVPLLSFNLGVETGQLAIAALVLPLIWKLKRAPEFALRYAPACSVLVSLAGAYWLVERVFKT